MKIDMRTLFLTLMMSVLSNSAFGASSAFSFCLERISTIFTAAAPADKDGADKEVSALFYPGQ